ncbi:DinB family protein [Geomicrobium sp. JCM 19055]|uniref:DinB family protein n=1 Tax=Geomicrobium sp. JCM 19055 TaxID=1460649 RepID=UPI00126961CF
MMTEEGYVYAASLNDELTHVIPTEWYDTILIESIGTPRQWFHHLIRVREVYRRSLFTGEVVFPGKPIPDDIDVTTMLKASSERLAEAFMYSERMSVKYDGKTMSISELISTAIQHEGIHTGQYYVALKHAGLDVPKRWQQDWAMS